MARSLWLLCCLLALSLAGCSSENIDPTYGRAQGPSSSGVNGTDVLAQMFDDAGHKVSAWRSMSPALAEADVIVWAPDDFDLPRADAQAWLDAWLLDGTDRVLIYIGRDFDAASLYWTKAQSLAPQKLQAEFSRRAASAQADAKMLRTQPVSIGEWTDIATLQTEPNRKPAGKLGGRWSRGIDSSKTEIDAGNRLVPPTYGRVLLRADDDTPLVTELTISRSWQGQTGRIMLIDNGSWLLNLPLVNHEHRKLAGRLIADVGPPERRVVFLESDAGGPPILADDPSIEAKTGFELFGVWPIGIALAQLAAVGITYAFACWPIFGVPKTGEHESLTDFRKHVTALGDLLRETRNRGIAIATLQRYRQGSVVDYRNAVPGPPSASAPVDTSA